MNHEVNMFKQLAVLDKTDNFMVKSAGNEQGITIFDATVL